MNFIQTPTWLDHVPNHVHDKYATHQYARSSLLRAQTSLATIIADLQEHTERFSLIRKEEAFKNEDMQMEANRLKAALRSMKPSPTNYIPTMDPELEDICALLERESASKGGAAAPTDVLRDFLQELDEQDDTSEVFPDVGAEISHACCLDQIAILQTYESGLDQVFFIRKMTVQLLTGIPFCVRLQVLSMLCLLR